VRSDETASRGLPKHHEPGADQRKQGTHNQQNTRHERILSMTSSLPAINAPHGVRPWPASWRARKLANPFGMGRHDLPNRSVSG